MNINNIIELILSDPIGAETRNSFDGDIQKIRMTPGIWTPFYHIMSEEEHNKIDSNTDEFKNYACHSRTKLLENAISGKQIVIKDHEIKLFFHLYRDVIDRDANFLLLDKLKTFIEYKSYTSFEEIYKKISRHRWIGATKPADFKEAHNLYYLPHLKSNKKYLYKISFIIPAQFDANAILFVGKVKNGTGVQFKYNNSALYCMHEAISLEEIK